MDALVTRDDFEASQLDGWTWVEAEVPYLECGYAADSYTAAAAFALDVAKASDAAMHHPDIDVRYQRFARVSLTTHGSGGVTQLDLDLAGTISELAAAANVAAGADIPR